MLCLEHSIDLLDGDYQGLRKKILDVTDDEWLKGDLFFPQSNGQIDILAMAPSEKLSIKYSLI